VPLGSDFGEDMQQRLVGADQERSSLDAPYFLAIHVLFFQNTKLIADFLVYISKERVRQVVFSAEFGLCFRSIARDAEHYCPSSLEFFESIAKAAGFNGAAWRVCSGIEEKHDGFAGIVR